MEETPPPKPENGQPEQEPETSRMETIKDPWRISRRLRVGMAVLLRRPMGGGDFWCSLAGWDRGEWLILNGVERLVMSGGLIKGAGLDFRFLARGSVHGFPSSVLSIFKDPPLVLLKWPASLQVVPVAGEPRSMVEVEVSILSEEPEHEGRKHRGHMLDISRSGCQVDIPRAPLEDPPFEQGNLLRVLLPLPGRDAPLPVEAEVRSMQVFRDSLRLGLRFTGGQDEARERIAIVLEQQLD